MLKIIETITSVNLVQPFKTAYIRCFKPPCECQPVVGAAWKNVNYCPKCPFIPLEYSHCDGFLGTIIIHDV